MVWLIDYNILYCKKINSACLRLFQGQFPPLPDHRVKLLHFIQYDVTNYDTYDITNSLYDFTTLTSGKASSKSAGYGFGASGGIHAIVINFLYGYPCYDSPVSSKGS